MVFTLDLYSQFYYLYEPLDWEVYLSPENMFNIIGIFKNTRKPINKYVCANDSDIYIPPKHLSKHFENIPPLEANKHLIHMF